MSRTRSVHQVQVAAATENSIGNEVLELRAALRRWGYRSEIYAQEIAPSMRRQARPLARFRPSPSDLVILHYSTGSTLTEYLSQLRVPLLLVYHNVTPPEFMRGLGGGERTRAERGRQALAELRNQTVMAVARSEFSRAELAALGFDPIQVLPVIVPEKLRQIQPDSDVLVRYQGNGAANLLFVGRIVPNKRQEDLIKTLYYYRQIDTRARLLLVGTWSNTRRYAEWLRQFAHRLDLDHAVHLCGHVSDSELAAFYAVSDVFVCMSEHEGFGIPLVEAMRFGLPIIAYASTAVPETLGRAGILVRQKRFPVVAELVHLLQTDSSLRSQVVARQRERARAFDVERVLEAFRKILYQVVGGEG